ncbi:hypothetical protein [Antrihabitans cavernicola]|uniref:Uncharacterized protein n=1 Tax=Antrihabitans cavernicola TaxID=2495913 RepID=A0A5A7S4E8_9NOCA|nr:hypothetical protein [Spelaeibacter cavernicola]KAA0015971.1 hypothetical protein FOY51_26825 [Spelaeibacter cavernicola]
MRTGLAGAAPGVDAGGGAGVVVAGCAWAIAVEDASATVMMVAAPTRIAQDLDSLIPKVRFTGISPLMCGP